jgi:hypothetical protein
MLDPRGFDGLSSSGLGHVGCSSQNQTPRLIRPATRNEDFILVEVSEDNKLIREFRRRLLHGFRGDVRVCSNLHLVEFAEVHEPIFIRQLRFAID